MENQKTVPEKSLTKTELEQQNAELRAKLDALTNKPGTTVSGQDDPMRPVTIELPYDGERYKDDLYVGINHKNFQIQRGKPVTVPFYVAQAVQESADQDKATARMIAIKEMEYAGMVEKGAL